MIRLRDFTVGDFEAFSALSGDEPMFTFTKGRLDDAKVAELMDLFVAEPAALPRGSFSLVVEDQEGSLAGWAGLDGMDVAPGQAEFGWYLGSPYWGRGYATEATALLLEFGFSRLNRTRIIATADPDNAASIRVLEKSGLLCEGMGDPVATWRGVRQRLLFSMTYTAWAASRH